MNKYNGHANHSTFVLASEHLDDWADGVTDGAYASEDELISSMKDEVIEFIDLSGVNDPIVRGWAYYHYENADWYDLANTYSDKIASDGEDEED